MPAISITGTNGKSTVTRLITHILLRAGRHVGMTTSDGILVDERMVDPGDWTGPAGAQAILRRNDVDVAVLETARGGLVLRGHGLRVERRERVHQRLVGPPRPPGDPHARGARGGEVDDLPGDEARRLGRAQRRRPVRGRRRPSGAGAASPGSRSTRIARRSSPASDGPAARAYGLLGAGSLVEWDGESEHEIVEAADVPVALGGLARHNLANALAAAGGARALGMSIAQVADGLRDFRPSAELRPAG